MEALGFAIVLMLIGSAIGAIWSWWTGRRPSKEERIRTVALELAILSHGEAPGEEADQCFTGRAKHFEKYLNGGPL